MVRVTKEFRILKSALQFNNHYMRLILIIAALLIYCSCGKVYPDDNVYRCWSCELKKNGTTIKFDTCLYGSVHNVLFDSSRNIFFEGGCSVK